MRRLGRGKGGCQYDQSTYLPMVLLSSHPWGVWIAEILLGESPTGCGGVNAF